MWKVKPPEPELLIGVWIGNFLYWLEKSFEGKRNPSPIKSVEQCGFVAAI